MTTTGITLDCGKARLHVTELRPGLVLRHLLHKVIPGLDCIMLQGTLLMVPHANVCTIHLHELCVRGAGCLGCLDRAPPEDLQLLPGRSS